MKKLNRRGQGTTEYIVILAIVVAIAIGVIWMKLNTNLSSTLESKVINPMNNIP